MASSVNPLTSTSSVVATSNQKGAVADPSSKLANEQTFLQLLVAQIKNQDPLNPSDSLQFVSQLAQFSQLEQTIAMRQDADAIRSQMSSTDATPAQTQS